MPNIVHRISTAAATPEEMFEAVSTKSGFASWWTEKMEGTEGLNGVLKFRFSEGGPDFQIIELESPEKVTLRCVVGPDEWIGTDLTFDISTEDGETILLFGHRGWREEIPFMHHCSTQWAYFLLGLKQMFETGRGLAYGPNYMPISNWASPTPPS